MHTGLNADVGKIIRKWQSGTMQRIPAETWRRIVEQAKRDGLCPPPKDDPVWHKPAIFVRDDGSMFSATSISLSIPPTRNAMPLSEAEFHMECATLIQKIGTKRQVKKVMEFGLDRIVGVIVLEAGDKVLACIESNPS